MVHPRAKLTEFGRQLVIQRVLVLGWSPAQAAAATGVSRATVYKWVGRFKQHGAAGLADRSSRPIHCRHALPPSQVARILAARRRWKQGPHRLASRLGLARSTIYGVLRRHQLSRLRDADRTTAIPIRYVRERPGELLHLDTKKLGRIPPGGGHRMFGRSGHRFEGYGYDYLHVAIDDCSRFAFVQIQPDERDQTTARFVLDAAAHFAERGIRIERVLTDNGNGYRSRAFAGALAKLGTHHRWTRPYRPQTNGKAERFIKTMLEEWAYARLYRDNASRLTALPRWVAFYNRRRSHTALNGRTPAAALVNNVDENHN